jgi:hypothetical protein
MFYHFFFISRQEAVGTADSGCKDVKHCRAQPETGANGGVVEVSRSRRASAWTPVGFWEQMRPQYPPGWEGSLFSERTLCMPPFLEPQFVPASLAVSEGYTERTKASSMGCEEIEPA